MNGERPIDSNPAGDDADRALARLYAEHVGHDASDAERPSPASDARIRKLAHDAVERPRAGAAAATPSGWRSWLGASWFRPGLAFAAVASLSVVIVALMPRENLEIEREAIPAATPAANAPAPSGGSPAAGSAAPVSSAAPTKPEAAAPNATKPEAERSEAKSEPASTATKSEAAPPSGSSSATQSRAPASAREPTKADSMSLAKRAIGSVTRRDPSDLPATSPAPEAVLSRPAAPPASVLQAAPAPPVPIIMAAPPQSDTPPGSPARAKTRQAETASAAAGIGPSARPNPFPGQGAATTGSPSEPRTDRSVEEGRVEKPSLITEPADARAPAQPLPEVRDSVPTYSNEVRPSIPLPNSYIGPRAPARDAAPVPPGAGSGPAAAMRAQAMQKRSFEGLTAQVSPSHRDPAEWIKSIQKLRTEGKLEQVTKELAEFRKTFPAYAIPDELKPFAPK